jgi:hypothetical protein
MSLIWSDSVFRGDGRSMAALATAYAAAEEALAELPDTDARRPAFAALKEQAGMLYAPALEEEDTYWATRNDAPRTHALIIGIGKYSAPGIPDVTTSVHGAHAFADYLLTEFFHRDRPIGSIELLLSGDDRVPRWSPSDKTADVLGIARGGEVRVERATSANIQNAFNRWKRRAGRLRSNGALFYYSGHGVQKASSYLLPEDAALPSGHGEPRHLIDLDQTVVNLMQFEPELQCFFIDACQETDAALLNNVSGNPGRPLAEPANGRRSLRDASVFYGSHAGRSAYGPPNAPPFFTQDLIACLKRHAVEPNKLGDVWEVTTASLKKVLKPAGEIRSCDEKQSISFAGHSPVGTNLNGQICHFHASPEIFIEVRCRPHDALPKATLFVTDVEKTQHRKLPQPTPWYTKVPLGPCVAGADFAPAAKYARSEQRFTPAPPFAPFELSIQPSPPPSPPKAPDAEDRS